MRGHGTRTRGQDDFKICRTMTDFFVAKEFVANPHVTKSAVSGGEIMEWRTDGQ